MILCHPASLTDMESSVEKHLAYMSDCDKYKRLFGLYGKTWPKARARDILPNRNGDPLGGLLSPLLGS